MLRKKASACLRVSLLAAAAGISFAGSADAAVIVNGGFEDASVDPGGGFATLDAGSTAIDGWLVEGPGGVDYIGGYWQPHEGARSLDLSGSGAFGGISQVIATNPGEVYTVSFWLAGNPDGGTDAKVTFTSIGGNQVDTAIFNVGPANTRDNMGWQQYFYTFTAFSTQSKLTFASGENSPYGPALDSVSIVPEPAMWALLLSGFGAIGYSLRRRPVRALQAV